MAKYFRLTSYLEKNIDFYIFMGEKSIGKTYGTFQWIKKQYETKGDGFFWVFPTDEECKAFKNELNSYLDPEKYFYQTKAIYDKTKDNKPQIASIFGLTTAFRIKNLQIAKNYVFDEFSHVNYSHKSAFTLFIKSLSNMERTKSGVRIFALSNSLSQNNMFFNVLKLKFTQKELDKNGGVHYFDFGKLKGKLVMIPDGMYHGDVEKENSLAYNLSTLDADLNQALFHNKFTLDDNRMVWMKKVLPTPKRYLCNFKCIDETVGVYLDFNDNLIFSSQKVPIKRFIYATIYDFLANQKNRIVDKDQDDTFLLWENKIYREKCFFETHYLKDLILLYLSKRKAKD